METFSALLAVCAGNSLVTGEFPTQRSVTRSFNVFFDLRLNKRLRKQSRGWWFETPSCSLCRHCNALHITWLYSRPKSIEFPITNMDIYVYFLLKEIYCSWRKFICYFMTWITNYIHYEMWDKNYLSIRNHWQLHSWILGMDFIPLFTGHMMTYSCWDWD